MSEFGVPGGGRATATPGLLVARRVRRPSVRWDVGLVHPHEPSLTCGVSRTVADAPGLRVRVINVQRTAYAPRHSEIAACSAIVTTSLHGLVTADAFGIPAVWTTLGAAAQRWRLPSSSTTNQVITPEAQPPHVAFDERMDAAGDACPRHLLRPRVPTVEAAL